MVLCGDLYQEVNASLNTGDFYEFTGGCNANLEQSSVWYTFTVQADGLLSFVLDPLNPIDDYDWGLFNITAGGCDGIGSQLLSPEMGCNSYGVAAPEPNGATGISTANGGTGNSNGPGNLNGPAFNADLPVLAGEQYALVVMNWTNSLGGVLPLILDNQRLAFMTRCRRNQTACGWIARSLNSDCDLMSLCYCQVCKWRILS